MESNFKYFQVFSCTKNILNYQELTRYLTIWNPRRIQKNTQKPNHKYTLHFPYPTKYSSISALSNQSNNPVDTSLVLLGKPNLDNSQRAKIGPENQITIRRHSRKSNGIWICDDWCVILFDSLRATFRIHPGCDGQTACPLVVGRGSGGTSGCDCIWASLGSAFTNRERGTA